MLKKGGLLLGDYQGAEVYYDDDAPMLIVAPARSGKGTSFILPNLLLFFSSGYNTCQVTTFSVL